MTGTGPGSDIDAGEFRRVLGHLPTGVTVVTAWTPDGPVGMAANSVTSVSLEPPLVLFCVAATSTTWPAIDAVGRYCVNVVAGHHEELVRGFSRRGIDRFAGVGVDDRPGGPGLDDAVAWLDCAAYDRHVAGDHTIVVARVLAVEAAAERHPLVFYRGGYGTFAPVRDAS
ncbi:flavin reductase family protein [Pseudonocardia sp. ICBG1122]|nr:flavin reductase family protein [Pseudonocardia pini]